MPTISDFIASYKKYGAECLVFDPDSYREPKPKGEKKKKKSEKASITWIPFQFKGVDGKLMYPKFKFSEVVLAGGAKYRDDGDRGVTSMKVCFRKLNPDEIDGPGFEPLEILITEDQKKQIMGLTKKVNEKTLPRIKKTLKDMFKCKRNYRKIFEQFTEYDPEGFEGWLDEFAEDSAERQVQENDRNKKMILEYANNTTEFARFAECVAKAFEENTQKLIGMQDQCEFTIDKVKKGNPVICSIMQDKVETGEGKNAKVEILDPPLFRFTIPVHKSGKVGKHNYKKDEFEPVVYDIRKSTKKNKFAKVPAKVKDEKGKMRLLTYQTAGSFITFKSVVTGSVTLKDMATHMFGISLSNELTDMSIYPNESESRNDGFDEQAAKKMKRHGSDEDESSDEELPEESGSAASGAGSGSDSEGADNPFDSDEEKPKKSKKKPKKAAASDSDGESDDDAPKKPKKSKKKAKKPKKAAAASDSDGDSDDDVPKKSKKAADSEDSDESENDYA